MSTFTAFLLACFTLVLVLLIFRLAHKVIVWIARSDRRSAIAGWVLVAIVSAILVGVLTNAYLTMFA